MGIKSTIRGGLAGVKRAIVGPSGGEGPAIDPLIAESSANTKDLSPSYDFYQQPLRKPGVLPDIEIRPVYNPSDDAPPMGIERPAKKLLPKEKRPDFQTKDYKKPAELPPQGREPGSNPSRPYDEPDKANPMGIERPDFQKQDYKTKLQPGSKSQYDGMTPPSKNTKGKK